jgi:preprotein translocase subunit SecD
LTTAYKVLLTITTGVTIVCAVFTAVLCYVMFVDWLRNRRE